ncbi:hypothetical protein GCM10028833_14930 [Glycomyces tarimensis]
MLLIWLAVGIALWQLYRRTAREREAAVQRERLRIARDMHDSLGRRLGLAAVQAGALEVSARDPETAKAVRLLGDAVRSASDELHELVGVLRDETDGAARDLTAVTALVAESRRAGNEVELLQRGTPSALPPPAGRAAYGVIEEGLANASKHATGRPVRVSVTWEDDALLVSVSNPVGTGSDARGGFGLIGVRERVEAAGGLLDVRAEHGEFALGAMLPLKEPGRLRPAALAGAATLVVLLAMLPISVVAGPQP